jgi:hypothetical protein
MDPELAKWQHITGKAIYSGISYGRSRYSGTSQVMRLGSLLINCLNELGRPTKGPEGAANKRIKGGPKGAHYE